MRVFTKLGLVFLAIILSAGVLVAQSFNDYGPKEVKQTNIPQTDDMFDVLFDWPVGVGGGEAGIETDGTYIYTSKWNGTGEFYQYDQSGALVATLNVPGSGGCRDIAYNGTYFYGGAASTTIFEMDILNETMISTFTGPTACRAIAYNEDDDVFYCNNWSDDITAFDPSGAFVSSFPTGPVGASYYGFAYESSSYCGAGPYLWGAAQTGNTLNELVQMDPVAGVETGVYFDVGSVAAVGTGIAGGLAIDDMFVPGFYTIIGTAQNVNIWGLELCQSGPGLDNDLGVQSITAPSSGLNLTSAEPVTILVKNYGNNAQTNFDVSFTLDGGTPVVESVSTTIDPGAEYQHTFGTTVDLSAYGMYDIEACVALAGDENPNNDCKDKMVENIEPSLCLDGLYTSGCGFGDGLISWDLANVNVDPIDCDGPQYLWYHDYTDMVHEVEPGMDYLLTVVPGYNDTWLDVWVDWNGDLFMDEDEHLVNDWELLDEGVIYETTITIPSDAPMGEFILRYRTNWTSAVLGSCDIYTYGNMADFHISTGASGPMMATLYPYMEDFGTGSTDGTTKTETSMINAIGDVEKGWVKWDISDLESKADVTIDSIWMWVYVNETNWPYWRITPLATDPVTGDPGTLFDEIVAGQDDAIAYAVNNESSSFDVGWHGYKLINNANSDLENAIGNGWFGTGVGDTDVGTTYYLLVDGWEETNMPYLEVFYSGGGGSSDCEDFDALAAGDYVALELGDPWDTWSSAPGTGEDAMITDAQAASLPNSFVVAPNVDLIYKFGDAPIDMGPWLYSHNMYVPSGSNGYFNIQSEPTPGVAWVCEYYFNDGGAGEAIVDGVTTDFTFPQDEWFWVGVNIDLDMDMGEFWINDEVVVSFVTTNTIGGVDYFGATADDAGHIDDVCFGEGYPLGGGNLEPPTNLEASVFLSDVELTWDSPAGFTLNEIAYDDGTNEAIFWVGEPSSTDQYLALRLTMPEDGVIEEIALSASSPDGSSFNDVIVAADDGSGAPDLGATFENFGTVAVPTTTATWMTLELTSPFGLTAGEDFWILVNWPDGNLGTNGPFIGADNTVLPTEDRNYWSNVPGTWNLWSDHWWMMRAYYSVPGESYTGNLKVIKAQDAVFGNEQPVSVLDPVYPDNAVSAITSTIVVDGMEDLTGYNVYRDGESIDFTTDEMYDDLGLDPGMYEYYVTAVYDEGESDPSNTVEVEVEEIVQEDCEDFDDLNAGEPAALQLGGLWTTWSNSPGGADDAVISDAVSLSSPNSMLVDGVADMLQLFNQENLTSGKYKVSLNIYVPTGTTGYFNLQKDIAPGVEWGFQVMFEEDGLQYIDGAGAAAVLWPFDYDTWILCEMYVDLDNDWMQYFVDGELVHEYQWTLGTFGTPGANTLGGANYYANPGLTGTPPGAHFDDICFEDITPAPCDDFDDLTVGGYVAEQLGGNWTTWSGAPGTAEDALITDAQAFSTPNSFIVDPNVDLIRTFGPGPIDEGAWLYSHQMYVASGTTGYFNVQSEPTPGVVWVIELYFNDGGAGQAIVDGVTTDFTYPMDEWFWAGVNFDLDTDLGEFWINDDVLLAFESANTIGGIDYFGAAATDAAYYDDVCFEEGYPIVPDPCYHFDELEVGGYVAEQLGDPWDTWSGTPGTAEDAFITDAQSFSDPNSFIVDPNVDLIFKFDDAPLSSGAWLYSHMMYVASGTTGYFNVQSEPTPGVAWVVEITFNDGGAGTFVHDGTTADFSYTQDEWFWVGVNMDVDNGIIDIWFNESVVYTLQTINTVGGIDYFGAAATDAAYYDDVCFEEGYEILPPPAPEDLVAMADGSNMELTWVAPGGDEKSSVMMNQWTGTGSGAPVEKDPNAKNNPIPTEDQFDLLFDFGPAGTAEAGIETDGMYIYTSVWSGTGEFLKYDQAGNFVEEFTISGAAGCRDIAYNGTYFYGGAASTTIFEMDFDAQTMVSTFTGPAAARAIAYNEVDDAFYCNNWSDNITKFDMSGANLGSFPVGPVGASYYGFAFDNYSGGTYLWGYAQAGANTNELVQIELPSGTETGVYFDVGSVISTGGTGIAGGLAIDGNFVPDTWTIIGNMQGISLFGLELSSNTGLMGYNIYHSYEGAPFTFLDFTTETSYVDEELEIGEHCYYVTAVYEFLESDPSNTACDLIISVEENLAANIDIFPNPASSVVNIQSDYTINYITVYNFAGQVVSSEQVRNTNYRVNVSEFNPGVYIFQIDTDEGRLTERIVIE